MAQETRYRIESHRRQGSEKVYHYLLREFWVDGKRYTVSKLLKTGVRPSAEETAEYIRIYAKDLEAKAEKLFVEHRVASFSWKYLSDESAVSLERMRYLYRVMHSVLAIDEVEWYEREVEYQYIHGTTAVEGNTLSFSDTISLLEHDIVPPGKSLREIYEVQNFKAVSVLRNSYSGKIDFAFIKKLHKLIMANILSEPGRFRTSDGFVISGCDFQLTPALLIEDELEALISQYYEQIESGANPFECAVLFHYYFESIHPFTDGNGRVGRELMNYLLMKSGYPRFLVLKEKRSEYLAALRMGNKDNFSGMVEAFSHMMIEQRIAVIEANTAGGLADIWGSKPRSLQEPKRKYIRKFF